MSARVIDPSAVSAAYRAEVRTAVAALGRPLRLVGILTEDDGPARTYARYARKGADEVGIAMDLWDLTAADVPAAIHRANADPDVDGLFLYYPLVSATEDRWLRELVDPRKDIEGMHSFWSRLLYENWRWVDEGRTQRAVLPCTPLGILKLLDAAGVRGRGGSAPLEGIRVCVINRSEIVGRPLSAMLANDGATVVSLDLTGTVVFEPAIGTFAHVVRPSDLDRAAALRDADVVVTGVPSRDFPLVTAEEVKDGAVCVNFSQFRNFDDDVLEKASAFVPRVGPMTVTMAMRNLLRLVPLRQP